MKKKACFLSLVAVLVLMILTSTVTAFGSTRKESYKKINTKPNKWFTLKQSKDKYNSKKDVNEAVYYMYKVSIKSPGYITIKFKTKHNESFSLLHSMTDYNGYNKEDFFAHTKSGKTVKMAVEPGTFYMYYNSSVSKPKNVGKFQYTFTKVTPTENYSPGTAILLNAGQTVTVCMTPHYCYSRWYKIQVTQSQKITLQASIESSNSNRNYSTIKDHDIMIFNSCLEEIPKKQAGSGSSTFITKKKIEPGIYYIRVSSDYYSDDYYIGGGSTPDFYSIVDFSWQ